MCQLRGLAFFRAANNRADTESEKDKRLVTCKLGGQSLEAADVQLAIIEQHEADIALKKE